MVMRFKVVVMRNSVQIKEITETIERGLVNTSMTAEEVIKKLQKIKELLEVNIDMVDREED